VPAGRFYVEELALIPGDEIVLPDDLAHQARDVLRLSPGDALVLLDGVGGEYSATLTGVGRRLVSARVGLRTEGVAEPAVRVVLYQGLVKAAKFETILQKGTELGVAAFVPLLTERTVAAVEEAGEAKRRRWARIVVEAMEQCGGTHLPDLHAPRPLPQALASPPPGALGLIPWEEERGLSLRAALEQRRAALGTPSEVRLFIGPEGGFSAAEIALARRAGVLPVTLGRRILRAETAALVAVALALDAAE
jgi:16S rRNA (uracil1498-N3)-methyltransferase